MHHGLVGGRARGRGGLRAARPGRPAGGGGGRRRRLPRGLPARGGGDRPPLRPRRRAPRGERDDLGPADEGRPDRPVRDGQRGPGLGRARAARPHPPALRPLRLPRRLRPPARAARTGRRLLAGAGEPGRRPRRGPAHRPLPRGRPQRRQPLPRRRPAERGDGPAVPSASSARWSGRGPRSASAATTRRAGSTSPPLRLRRARHGRAAHGAPRRRPLRRAGDGRPRTARRRRPRSREQRRPPGLRPARRPAPRDRRRDPLLHALRPPLRGHPPGPRRRPARRGRAGDRPSRRAADNGDWPPHLHFQVVLDLLAKDADFPGVALPSQRAIWTCLSPDPNVLLRIPAERFPPGSPPPARRSPRGGACSGGTSRSRYRRPLKIVRGWRSTCTTRRAGAYLDAYNNVPHVGHGHPRVVRAAQEQLALLNTNTRYLHDTILRYAERLTRLLPEPLWVCYFVDLGQRGERARAAPRAGAHGRRGRDRPRARLPRPHDDARGREPVQVRRAGRQRAPGVGARGAASGHLPRTVPPRRPGGGPEVRAPRRRPRRPRCGPTGARSRPSSPRRCPSVAGQVVFPPGYLAEAYRHVRAAGGRAHRRRGADGLRPARRALLGLRGAGGRARHRRPRQAHRATASRSAPS